MSLATDDEKMLSTVYAAIQTLHGVSRSEEKHAASTWLAELQGRVEAWKIADQLCIIELNNKQNINACYFGAQTLRSKIQNSFMELPQEAHCSLRDSLLSHISNIDSRTESSVVRQLCLAVADLMLQMTSWADPIGHLLSKFQNDPKHWWPVLEILRLVPEEVHCRTLQLGENRRNQFQSILEGSSQVVLNFLRQTLMTCVNGHVNTNVVPVELCGIEVVECFGSWVSMNPELYCGTAPNDNHIVMFALNQLREGKCSRNMHRAATDCLCGIIDILPVLDSSSNNNGVELQSFQINLFTWIMGLEEAYHYAVAEEDLEKTLNYCRIFTEYSISMISNMLRSWRDPHFSIRSLDRVLLCTSHHDYEVAEITYDFWNQLSEDLYHAHDEYLNTTFRPYVQRLILCLFKHCRIEPDQEGPLSDEFYHFRKQTAELFQDFVFVVGPSEVFTELKTYFLNASGWDDQEAALYLMHCATRNIHPENTGLVWPVMQQILEMKEWPHFLLKVAAIRLIGSLPTWLNKNADLALEKTLAFLVSQLATPETSTKAAAALENICAACGEIIAAKHIEAMLGVVEQVDHHNIHNEASVGLYRGLGHVLSCLPCDKLTVVLRQVCNNPLQRLQKLLVEQHIADRSFAQGSYDDPVHWIDRTGAVFRTITVPKKNFAEGVEHPCKAAVCQDFWPMISLAFNKHQADVRVMERCCRSVRFAVRCIGRDSLVFLSDLVGQLVAMYTAHPHSCFLYLTSILVDEFGGDPQCTSGLLQTLEAFLRPTFDLFQQQNGLVNNPDTVDDFFRLCTRFTQKCAVPFLKSSILGPIVQCAQQASELSHRDANAGVLKFLYDIVHAGRRHKDAPDYAERHALVRSVMLAHGTNLVSQIILAVLFSLPTYTYQDVSEFLTELKDFMAEEYAQWLECALRKLPDRTASGKQAATIDQLHEFHKKATNAKSPKELSKAIKEFSRLYR